jgi:hypothetical protein
VEIHIGKGIGTILFGMREAEIVEQLGAPNRVWLDSNDSRDLMYYRHQLVLKIEPNGRLGWIEVHDRNARWRGIDLWTAERSELLYLLAVALDETADSYEYASTEFFSFDDSEVELQYQLGRLDRFNFGVQYDEQGEQKWPEQES